VPGAACPRIEVDGAKAYQWKSDEIVGSAEETHQDGGKGFGGMVAAYFERMSGRCNVTSLHTDGKVAEHGGVMVQTARLPASATRRRCRPALLFVSDGKTFSASCKKPRPTA